mmetsp:Transcript_30969/g.52349  ORF Transcript_30969/g.52349 Transcript_30969/m.52349 type:complete len:259 (-) Transcript_30969:252-1028(-)|eukprot:CAMPEP_0174975540 /NCGR_PEP_ID=MMETSP0004_2-20121128/12500_1 /TAXON_ID=420556 /ORGANISM="Ochromonas sp., Strain CCMP1393" /LENGTH=258 /DNA_ID=CAMNT_0016226403 /DNA_START=64 /DNA_END=840 /DNA_ORIENTATION=-
MASEAKEPELSAAEKAKKEGNDAFLAKDYQEAIKHYSKAIELEPNTAIFYSNRSACHASLKDWQLAHDDALVSISKDPKFIKGYYRLASAQIEMQKYDDAETTIRAALTLEPGNEVLMKLLRTLKQKKSAAVTAGKSSDKAPKQLDEATIKEAMEIQQQLGAYQKDLRAVRSQLAAAQRQVRVNSVTTNQITELDDSVNLYRSLGKAFVYTPKKDIEAMLEKEIGDLTKANREMTDREEYLTRRITSSANNLKDLTGQ